MAERRVSLVVARKNLGRLVEQVSRTGTPVKLTRRGEVVARVVREEPKPKGRRADPLARVRGTLMLRGSVEDLTKDIQDLRAEGALSLERRQVPRPKRAAKRRG